MDEEKIAQALRLLELASQGSANPDEVAEVFRLVFTALDILKRNADKESGDARAYTRAKIVELRLQVEKIQKSDRSQVTDLVKVVKDISAWRKEQDAIERALPDDVTTALDIGNENQIEIRDLRRKVLKILARKTPKLKDGKPGKMPDHEWDGTKIRFENPDGTWGEWVDVKGNPGGVSLFGGDGGSMGGVRRIRAGTNVTITGDPGEPTINASGGSGGANVATERLTGTQSGNNITLDLTGLANVFISVLLITRQGVIATPGTDSGSLGGSWWTRTSNTVTVTNAASDEVFLVQYTY